MSTDCKKWIVLRIEIGRLESFIDEMYAKQYVLSSWNVDGDTAHVVAVFCHDIRITS